MCGKSRRHRAPSATPWDGIPEGGLTPPQALVAASQRSIYAFRHERFAGDAEFFNGYPRESCPRCGFGRVVRAGFDRRGVQRWSCRGCGRTFTPATGTVFEDGKLPVAAWADFVLQALSFESVAAMTREDRRADTTHPYWMAKLFAVLSGVQDGVVLSGRAWVDEAYWPVAARDAWRKPDGTLPRGLSRNQMCIAVGVDADGRSVLAHEGFGKPSRGGTRDALGAHVGRGSTLVHDKEKAHAVLVERLGLVDESHDARLLKGVPDELNPLEPANRMCYMVQRFLRAHSGFDRADLQGYLDLLWVAVNPPADKLEKVAFVLDRAMRCPKTLRYRDFYNMSPRSSEGRG